MLLHLNRVRVYRISCHPDLILTGIGSCRNRFAVVDPPFQCRFTIDSMGSRGVFRTQPNI